MSNYYLTAEGDALSMKERVFIRDMARKVVKRFGKDALLVNIGVHRGGTLWCLRAGSGPGVRIIGIDINAESWPGDWEFLHGDSRRVHEDIEGPIHLLLVDGDHDYYGVRADIENWTPKVAEGGLVLFHDYGNSAAPGVKEYADSLKWEVTNMAEQLAVLRKPAAEYQI